jgi:hypothetical protein
VLPDVEHYYRDKSGEGTNERQKTVALARPASNLSINGEINKQIA